MIGHIILSFKTLTFMFSVSPDPILNQFNSSICVNHLCEHACDDNTGLCICRHVYRMQKGICVGKRKKNVFLNSKSWSFNTVIQDLGLKHNFHGQ